MKRILVLAVAIFVLALMVSSVSADVIVNPPTVPGATSMVSTMDSGVSLDGGKSTPVIFAETADSGTVTLDTIKVDPTIGK